MVRDYTGYTIFHTSVYLHLLRGILQLAKTGLLKCVLYGNPKQYNGYTGIR